MLCRPHQALPPSSPQRAPATFPPRRARTGLWRSRRGPAERGRGRFSGGVADGMTGSWACYRRRSMSELPWDKVDAALGPLPLMSQPGWDRLTPAQRWFVAMEVVEGQVGNGGFHAVYFNDCAGYLPLALAGYEAIGAAAQAEIVRSVLQTMKEDPWAGPPNTWPDPDAEDSPPGSKDI